MEFRNYILDQHYHWKISFTSLTLQGSEAPTSVDKATRSTFAELFRLVGERDLHDPRDVSGRGLYPDGVGSDELKQSYNMYTQPSTTGWILMYKAKSNRGWFKQVIGLLYLGQAN